MIKPRLFLAVPRLALGLLSRSLRRALGISLLLSILMTVFDLASTIVVVPLVLALQGGPRPTCPICSLWPDQPSGPHGVILAAALFAATMLARQAVDLTNTWTSRHLTQNIHHLLTHRLAEHYLAAPWLDMVRDGSPVRLKHCLSSALDAAYGYQVILDVLSCATEVLLLGSVLLFQVPQLTIGLGLGLGLALVLVRLCLRHRLDQAVHAQDMMGRQLHRQLTQAFESAREIKIYQAQGIFLTMLDHTLDRLVASRKTLSILPAIPRQTFELVVMMGLTAMVVAAAGSNRSSTPLLIDLAVLVVAARRLLPSMSRLLSGMAELSGTLGNLTLIHRELSTPLPVAAPPPPPLDPLAVLELDRISFAYPDGTPVLDQVSLRLGKGDRVAIMGPSGAGKSSLLMVAAGLAEPASGILRRAPTIRMAYVPQETVLLDDSLKANILFGLDDPGEAPLWDILDAVGLGPFVRQLPEGLMAAAGDHGFKLSGGQRQRIGLARALFRRPDLLMLDEATSALDAATEIVILSAIDRFVGPGAVLYTTHRPATLALASAIYHLEAGRLIAPPETTAPP